MSERHFVIKEISEDMARKLKQGHSAWIMRHGMQSIKVISAEDLIPASRLRYGLSIPGDMIFTLDKGYFWKTQCQAVPPNNVLILDPPEEEKNPFVQWAADFIDALNAGDPQNQLDVLLRFQDLMKPLKDKP